MIYKAIDTRPSFLRTSRLYLVLVTVLAGMLVLAACSSEPAEEATVDEQPVEATVEAAEEVEATEEEVAATPVPTEEAVETEAEGADAEAEEPEADDAETDAEADVEEAEAEDADMIVSGVVDAEGALVRGAMLLDYDFQNRDGEVSGDLEDLLVDVSNGNILFASVEYGGILDLGDTDIVVPLSAFVWGAEDELILNFDEQVLENFPDVGNDWPDIADPAWDDDVNTFWSDNGFATGIDFDETNTDTVMWLSDMTGFALVDLGEGVGTIQDVMVNLGNSRIAYLLFGFGTTPAAGGSYVIPYSALSIEDLSDSEFDFAEGIDMESLRTAPRYDPALYPDTGIMTEEDLAEFTTYWQDQGVDLD